MTANQDPRKQRRFFISTECGHYPNRAISRGYGTKDPSQPDPQVGDRISCGACGSGATSTITAVERVY